VGRFNKVVAYSIINGKNFILDATEQFSPPGLTPYSLLNTIGFVVERKDSKLVQIRSNQTYNNSILVRGTLDSSGTLSAEALLTSKDYAKMVLTEKIKESKKKYTDFLSNTMNPGITIDSIRYQNLDDEYKPLDQTIEFSHNYDETDGFVFFNFNLFTSLEKNPFQKDERFTNVNFGFPYTILLNEEIEIPETAVIEKMPENQFVQSPNREISLTREIRREGNKLLIRILIAQQTTLVPADSYDWLKAIFREMVEKLNEPVVIKVRS
jgi:hypothetical protein